MFIYYTLCGLFNYATTYLYVIFNISPLNTVPACLFLASSFNIVSVNDGYNNSFYWIPKFLIKIFNTLNVILLTTSSS